jgi:4-oxalocrotonate tautomerase family enzyme
MPTIHVEIWKGRPQASNKALAAALTQTVIEQVGCPAGAVSVIIQEVDKKDWYIGGKACQELYPEPR